MLFFCLLLLQCMHLYLPSQAGKGACLACAAVCQLADPVNAVSQSTAARKLDADLPWALCFLLGVALAALDGSLSQCCAASGVGQLAVCADIALCGRGKKPTCASVCLCVVRKVAGAATWTPSMNVPSCPPRLGFSTVDPSTPCGCTPEWWRLLRGLVCRGSCDVWLLLQWALCSHCYLGRRWLCACVGDSSCTGGLVQLGVDRWTTRCPRRNPLVTALFGGAPCSWLGSVAAVARRFAAMSAGACCLLSDPPYILQGASPLAPPLSPTALGVAVHGGAPKLAVREVPEGGVRFGLCS